MYERKQRAMKLKALEEQKKKEQKALLLKQKKERLKQLRQNMKTADDEKRQRFEEKNDATGEVKCPFCGEWVPYKTFDEHIVTHPSQIRKRVWLGDYSNQKDLLLLKRLGITHILNCAGEIKPVNDVYEYIGENNYCQIKLADKVKEIGFNKNNINIAIKFLEETLANNNTIVLIHCREGKSRSVSFLCAYLMWKEGLSFQGALSDVRSKRYIVMPNAKFYTVLEDIDAIFRKKNNGYVSQKKLKFKLSKISTKSGFNLIDYDRNNEMEMKPIKMKAFHNTRQRDRGSNHFRQRSRSLTEEEMNQIRKNYNELPLQAIKASMKKSRNDRRVSNRFVTDKTLLSKKIKNKKIKKNKKTSIDCDDDSKRNNDTISNKKIKNKNKGKKNSKKKTFKLK